MDAQQLGKRIKEARIRRRMTQSELVGGFITRNMLSRIESGNAYPSVKTLEYLARRLEIPLGQLMDGDVTPAGDVRLLTSAKRTFADKKYAECARLAKNLEGGVFSDEAAALIARCSIEQAKQLEKRGDRLAAADKAEKALRYADTGIYSSREIRTEAVLLLDRAAGNGNKPDTGDK